MKKQVCDKCGKEIEVKEDLQGFEEFGRTFNFFNSKLDILDSFDFCKKCEKELAKLIKKWIEDGNKNM